MEVRGGISGYVSTTGLVGEYDELEDRNDGVP